MQIPDRQKTVKNCPSGLEVFSATFSRARLTPSAQEILPAEEYSKDLPAVTNPLSATVHLDLGRRMGRTFDRSTTFAQCFSPRCQYTRPSRHMQGIPRPTCFLIAAGLLCHGPKKGHPVSIDTIRFGTFREAECKCPEGIPDN